MRNNLMRVLALALAVSMILTASACAGKKEEEKEPEKTYTLNEYLQASPSTWNPHVWETDADDYPLLITSPGFTDTTIAADGVNYEWVYEMADNITDITATYPDAAKWGVEAGETGRIYQIDLNKNACWEDGTPINADTYIYSMQQMLDSSMKNYRANSYITGSEAAIVGGNAYYNNDKAGTKGYEYTSLEGGGYASVAEAQTAGIERFFVDVNGFWGITAADGSTWVENTDETKIRDAAVPEGEDGDYISAKEIYDAYLAPGGEYEAYAPTYVGYISKEFTYENTPWEDVGLIKSGDYQLIYITELPISMFDFMVNGTSIWLVYEDLYEAGKKQVEGLTATNYGTSADTFMSYGPYKLASYEKDKQMVFEKNDKWYGYTDGKHEGQYQTTCIKTDILSEHNTVLQLFNQGKLDSAELTSDDITTYRMSDFLMKQDETYTMRFIFATDENALAQLEAAANDGANKKVIYYDDFRKAISLAIDRASFTAQATSGFKPAYYLINSLYYYDMEHDSTSIYRNTNDAKQAVLDLYGITYGAGSNYATIDEAYDAVTGYDIEAAKELFQSVYEQAIKDGRYTDGQDIKINAEVTAAESLSADDTKQMEMLNEFVKVATEGTGFEGKISFNFIAGAQNRYEDIALGKIEMIRGAWGGAAFYPFRTIGLYCEPDVNGGLEAIHESCGWDPTADTLEITYDFDEDGTEETVKKTFQNWAKSIVGGGEYFGNAKVSLAILSKLETGVLNTYQCIPVATYTILSLHSKQIEFGTYDYNIMYDFGGYRRISYNYDDAAWEAYVASQGGTLSYE